MIVVTVAFVQVSYLTPPLLTTLKKERKLYHTQLCVFTTPNFTLKICINPLGTDL